MITPIIFGRLDVQNRLSACDRNLNAISSLHLVCHISFLIPFLILHRPVIVGKVQSHDSATLNVQQDPPPICASATTVQSRFLRLNAARSICTSIVMCVPVTRHIVHCLDTVFTQPLHMFFAHPHDAPRRLALQRNATRSSLSRTVSVTVSPTYHDVLLSGQEPPCSS